MYDIYDYNHFADEVAGEEQGINIKLASSSHPANPTWADMGVKI